MTIKIITGDCRTALAELPMESVHCVVTSPPYWGLRDYGTAKWDGGDPDCSHSVGGQVQDNKAPGAIITGQRPGVDASQCRKCGAHRIDNQIGLEGNYQDYVNELVAVFRKVRRVLRKDGTVWLNLGDSYYSQRTHADGGAPTNTVHRGGSRDGTEGHARPNRSVPQDGLKPKDLVGIPWRIAFALQADGWYLRQDIIWHKPNPMPESVTDRCTKAHEYLFLLTKSERYFYDAEAIKESVAPSQVGRVRDDVIGGSSWEDRGQHSEGGRYGSGNKTRKPATERGVPENTGKNQAGSVPWEGNTRNKRSVWEVTTAPFSEAHFATFPPALIEPCILAGCPDKCCAKCGAPQVRTFERTNKKEYRYQSVGIPGEGEQRGRRDESLGTSQYTPSGFEPSCSCNAGMAPGVCLDPFGGAGTTGLVADRLKRNAVLIELNPAYAEMARKRLIDDAGMFASID